MQILEGSELKEAQKYIKEAAEVSKQSLCAVSHIGAVLVKNGKIIGKGFNGPTGKKCNPCILEILGEDVKTELCFAVHAKERAVLDALEKRHNPKGSILYFTHVENGKYFSTEDSFCAHCSRILLESDVERVVLPAENGFSQYDIHEYYDLSFDKFVKAKYIM